MVSFNPHLMRQILQLIVFLQKRKKKETEAQKN